VSAPRGGATGAPAQARSAGDVLDVFDGVRSSPADHRGQFVLSQDADRLPVGWDRRDAGGWLLATHELPVTDLVDATGERIGWCLGYPIIDGVLQPRQIRLATRERMTLDWAAVDGLYDRAAGRFALVVLTEEEPSLLLDAYGSLAAVHASATRTVASTPVLIGGEWDEDLIAEVGFPTVNPWLPFGLTLTKGVRRLQANHRLDLRAWTVERHWPRPGSLVEDPDPARVRAVHDGIRNGIAAVAAAHPVMFSLTAGRDSRLLLACARDVLDRSAFFTMAPPDADTVDVHVATRLAARFGLDHRVVPIRPSTPAALTRWQFLTGHTIGSGLWKDHESLTALDPDRVLLPGTAGEVGRGVMNRLWDLPDQRIDARMLVGRTRVPRSNAAFLAGASEWLDGLPDVPPPRVMDLAYIENRLSCWAGPGHYGNVTSRFEYTPFASRKLFTDMLALPADYRLRQRLVRDICRQAWPELLELPFNRYTGLRGARGVARTVRDRARRTAKKNARRMGIGHSSVWH
jgi:hypothetical protein